MLSPPSPLPPSALTEEEEEEREGARAGARAAEAVGGYGRAPKRGAANGGSEGSLADRSLPPSSPSLSPLSPIPPLSLAAPLSPLC
eukprot:755558-Rhodomonas_salina.1